MKSQRGYYYYLVGLSPFLQKSLNKPLCLKKRTEHSTNLGIMLVFYQFLQALIELA